MTDRDDESLWELIGAEYNPPPETPREELWSGIEARISTDPSSAEGVGAPAVDLAAERHRRAVARAGQPGVRRMLGWSVAAAAVLVLGIGIGRMSAPSNQIADGLGTAADDGLSAQGAVGRSNQLVARAHLGRTEALLTMVRADARDGRVDPAVAEWAGDLLAQTRLLLDRPAGVDPGLQDLLLDLELVLVQVVGLAESEEDDERSRTEIELTLKTLDEGGVLPRIQAQIPPTMAGA